MGNSFSSYEGENKDKLGVAPMPRFEGGKRANSIYFDGYGISSKSKHPQEALELIEYLTLSKNEDSIKLASGYLPTSNSMAATTGQQSDPVKSVFMEEMNHAVKTVYNPNFNKAWTPNLAEQFNQLLSAKDDEIAEKLRKMSLELDVELKRLKTESNRDVSNSSP